MHELVAEEIASRVGGMEHKSIRAQKTLSRVSSQLQPKKKSGKRAKKKKVSCVKKLPLIWHVERAEAQYRCVLSITYCLHNVLWKN